MTNTKSIIIEETLSQPQGEVWKVLTTAEYISAWLMDTDFVPEVGRSFTFRAKPTPEWDGLVNCKVEACKPQTRLSYSWQGGKDANRLDTVVTWDLVPVEGGTRLRMEQSGFVSPANDLAVDIMSAGWHSFFERLAETLNDLPERADPLESSTAR